MSKANEMTNPVEPIVMVPVRDDKSHHCMPQCPYLAMWEHPYFHHTAWCWKQMRNLEWYDYWLADCMDNEPDGFLEKHKASGRTKAP